MDWAHAIGKVGSDGALAVGALLLAWHWNVAQACVTSALTELLGGAAVIVSERHAAATVTPSNVSVQQQTHPSEE